MPQERPSRINLGYLSSCYGILKIYELICCSWAFYLCASFLYSLESRGLPKQLREQLTFFVFIEVAVWLFALLMIFLNVTGRITKNNVHCKPTGIVVTHGFIAVMLLAASSMCAKIHFSWYEFPLVCDVTDTTCQALTAVLGSGIVSLVLFVIDVVFHILAETKCYSGLVTTHTAEYV